MPYQFRFLVNHQLLFQGNLECKMCSANKANGTRCRRRVCLGLPYCFQHLKSLKHLQIKQSLIPNSGKGLFAVNPQARRPNVVVFNTGADICNYDGELINQNTLTQRYGQYTAPYGIEIQNNQYEDGALDRGVGSLVNHKPHRETNAEFDIVKVNRRNHHIKLVATRPIRNGEEIYVDYGNDYRMDEPTTNATVYRRN